MLSPEMNPEPEMNNLYVTQAPTTHYDGLRISPTPLHTLMASLSLIICEWRNQLHASFYIAFNQLPHLPHPLHSLSFHTFTRSNDSWAKSGIWCFHVAFMQGQCCPGFQHKSKGSNVTSYGWRDTHSPQLNFLFIDYVRHAWVTYFLNFYRHFYQHI